MIFIRALLVGLIYWLAMGRANYFFSLMFRQPLLLGVIYGALYGDVHAGLMYGANIQLMYIGVVAAGGNIPNDPALAASIAIPVAIVNGLDSGAAIAIAVPFGVMGVMVNNLRRTINTMFLATKVDKYIEEGEYKKAHKYQFIIPWLINGVMYAIPVFLINLIGPTMIQKVIEVIPTWLQNGIANAGNMLPALGFALTLVVMGKQYMPYFLLGFFIYAITGFSMLTGAIIAFALGMIVESVSSNNANAQAEGGAE